MDDKENSPVFIQSFEVGNLKELNTRIDVPSPIVGCKDIALNGQLIEKQPMISWSGPTPMATCGLLKA